MTWLENNEYFYVSEKAIHHRTIIRIMIIENYHHRIYRNIIKTQHISATIKVEFFNECDIKKVFIKRRQ